MKWVCVWRIFMVRSAIIGLGIQGKKYAEILYNNEIENMGLVGVVARSGGKF